MALDVTLRPALHQGESKDFLEKTRALIKRPVSAHKVACEFCRAGAVKIRTLAQVGTRGRWLVACLNGQG